MTGGAGRACASAMAGLVTVCALTVAACGGGDRDPEGADGGSVAEDVRPAGEGAAAGEAPGDGYTAVDVSGAGTIRGVVRFAGQPPAPRTVPVGDDRQVCGEERQVQRVRIDEAGGLRDAVVFIEEIERGRAFSTAGDGPVLDQDDCTFRPHVVLTAPDEVVRVRNSDPLTHNVHTLGFENRPRNLSQPPELGELELRFSRPERVKVECDIHPWMGAWIVVMAHPYYAVSAPDGAFQLAEVPAGTYRVTAWHEELGTVTQEVEVGPGASTEVALELNPG